MPGLCLQGAHLIQKMASGVYVCVHCAAMFHEHHALHVQVSTTGLPGEHPPSPRAIPAPGGRA